MHVDERDQVVVVTVFNDECAGLWKIIEPYLEKGTKGFVLDMSKANFLNSVNIAAIIAARNRVVASGGRIAVAGLADNIKAVFRILRLERLFDLEHGLESAIKQVR
jgi:anti-sigma B factor antagonist